MTADILAEIRSARGTDIREQLVRLTAVIAGGDTPTLIACCALLASRLLAGDFVAASDKLCDSGEHALAEQLVCVAAALFPTDLALLIQQARIPQRSGDPARALPLFQRVRLTAPYSPNSYYGEAECLRDIGRLDEAAQVLDEAVERFPQDLPMAITRADLAERRGRLGEAIHHWAQIQQRFPDWSGGYLRGAQVLRDGGQLDAADRVLRLAIERFPAEMAPQLEYAGLAQARGDWAAARSRWQQFLSDYPDDPAGYINAARIECEEGRFEVAETYLRQAIARFPADLHTAMEWAMLAVRLGALSDADDRWRELRERFPDEVAGYSAGLRALEALGRFEAAERLAAVAVTKFPDDQGVREATVRLAQRRLERSRTALAGKIADNTEGADDYIDLIQAMLAAGAFSDVGAVAAQAQAKFPDRMALYVLEARAAESAGETQSAAAAWERIQSRFPDNQEAYRQRAALLAGAGELAAAEAVMRDACERFPGEAWAFREYAALAETMRNWPEAVRRWSLVESRFGESLGERLHILRVKMLDAEIELAQQAGGDLSALLNYRSDDGPAAADGDDSRTVMMTFESLGGIATGCEFGAVQRAFGAEPLGLLRWSGMSLGTLIDVLEGRLLNIGEPATTEVGYYDLGDRREYSIRDKTFGFHMHSHVFANEMDEKTFFAQMTKRMKFLARKMLDDLGNEDKILVFKHSIREPSEDETDRLRSALAGYGKNVCMLVTSANDDFPSGSLKELRDNIWLGYLDFSGEYNEERAKKWLQLCRVAYRKFRSAAP